ncbi:mercury resistance system periplasmic binding protein MerP [Sessilibacter corallicola]|uniref:Periplasmic mercury ion-binding protein n=1 Tax=Sessilibacter corallicola TaxID=2904075 RepID=A0ABQ0A4A0_9GAMM
MKRLCLFVILVLASGYSLAERSEVSLSVPGMNCVTCPVTVRKSLEKVDGVASAEVDYKTRTAKVVFDTDKASVAQLVKATGDAGYPSKVISDE